MGNLATAVADADGLRATTQATYTALGQVRTTTNPVGAVTRSDYDDAGNVIAVTLDPGTPPHLDVATSFTYDAVGNVLTITDPKGNLVATTYDIARQPLTVALPAPDLVVPALTTAYTYDEDGRVVATEQSADGAVLQTTSTTYTPSGKPASATDPKGNVVRFAYDSIDRLTRITDPLGQVAAFGYDAAGRRTTLSDATIRAVGDTPVLLETRAYTDNGQLAGVTNANTNTVSFAYDGFDRLDTTTHPDASNSVLTYDADSNVVTATDRAGDATAFAYDTLNRLATLTPPNSEPIVSYVYDQAGRVVSVGDTSAAIAAAQPPSGGLAGYTTSTTYDALDRPRIIAFDNVATPAQTTLSDATFTHAYDAIDRRIGQTTEPPRDCRRLFDLSHATMAGSSICA